MQKKIRKKRRKNLQENYLTVSLQSARKKTLVLQIKALEKSGKKSWKSKEKFCLNSYGTYLCTPIKKLGGKKGQKFFERLETITLYSNIQVRFKRHIINRSHTLIFLKNYWRQMVKTHLQWRVWSWLRMNASGRLNTCKSWGSRFVAIQMLATGKRVRNTYTTFL